MPLAATTVRSKAEILSGKRLKEEPKTAGVQNGAQFTSGKKLMKHRANRSH